MAAIYILCKEWVKEETGEETEEDATIDVDEEKK